MNIGGSNPYNNNPNSGYPSNNGYNNNKMDYRGKNMSSSSIHTTEGSTPNTAGGMGKEPYSNVSGSQRSSDTLKQQKFIVSDAMAKNSRQLLFAHIYNYLVHNKFYSTASQFLKEVEVPLTTIENIGKIKENTVRDDSSQMRYDDIPENLLRPDMLLNASDTFLVEWWEIFRTLFDHVDGIPNESLDSNGNQEVFKQRIMAILPHNNPTVPPPFINGAENLVDPERHMNIARGSSVSQPSGVLRSPTQNELLNNSQDQRPPQFRSKSMMNGMPPGLSSMSTPNGVEGMQGNFERPTFQQSKSAALPTQRKSSIEEQANRNSSNFSGFGSQSPKNVNEDNEMDSKSAKGKLRSKSSKRGKSVFSELLGSNNPVLQNQSKPSAQSQMNGSQWDPNFFMQQQRNPQQWQKLSGNNMQQDIPNSSHPSIGSNNPSNTSHRFNSRRKEQYDSKPEAIGNGSHRSSTSPSAGSVGNMSADYGDQNEYGSNKSSNFSGAFTNNNAMFQEMAKTMNLMMNQKSEEMNQWNKSNPYNMRPDNMSMSTMNWNNFPMPKGTSNSFNKDMLQAMQNKMMQSQSSSGMDPNLQQQYLMMMNMLMNFQSGNGFQSNPTNVYKSRGNDLDFAQPFSSENNLANDQSNIRSSYEAYQEDSKTPSTENGGRKMNMTPSLQSTNMISNGQMKHSTSRLSPTHGAPNQSELNKMESTQRGNDISHNYNPPNNRFVGNNLKSQNFSLASQDESVIAAAKKGRRKLTKINKRNLATPESTSNTNYPESNKNGISTPNGSVGNKGKQTDINGHSNYPDNPFELFNI
ncbi:Transcription activator MSS11 [Nakaseomyces glabratus]|nr:Transcription activator MSS11 [Nakaseomyces glabratus]KTB20465.1 Transcription activator MSS11 [Nakaseomyces glabratus]KTB24556.1 Transcription activator MSS11 [Nakaseomyces glabratus]